MSQLFATPWTAISSFIFLRWLLESHKLPCQPVLSFVVPSPSQPFMPMPQTWAEDDSAADLCELGICPLADPIPPFLQEGLVRRFEASAEGLTLLGHMGVAHRESDLNNSLFFLLLLSPPLLPSSYPLGKNKGDNSLQPFPVLCLPVGQERNILKEPCIG